MSDFIPLSVPSIRGNEWKYVKECLDTEWVSSAGKFVDRFEKEIAAFTGARHAVACVNGTAALHTALIVAGVEPGDEVIVPTLTFIAPVNAIRYVNAFPVFMDCDDFYNIDAGKTMEFLERETVYKGGETFSKASGRRIRAVIPVHVFGNAAELEELVGACRERNIRVIEDATESLGTVYKTGKLSGRHAGTVGDIGCLSFNGNKIITTGGGGMILTDNDEHARCARYLTTQAKNDELNYVHDEVGYNYRLTNIQAALGVAQLERMPGYLDAKKKNYDLYRRGIGSIQGLSLAGVPGYADNNHWMYALRIAPDRYEKDASQTIACLGEHGIQARPVWRLNHLQKPYADAKAFRISRALSLAEKTINIPCSVGLTSEQIEIVLWRLANG